MKLVDINALDLAQQLTLIESKLFAKTQPTEYLNRSKHGKPRGSDDNISAIIDASKKFAEWVVDSVLSMDSPNKRANIVKHFIAVADHCRLLHNFSTMAALVAGLKSPPIRRLKYTWEQVSPLSKTQLQEAERAMDTKDNMSNYGVVLKSAQLPCVPFVGHYLMFLSQDENRNMIQADIKHYQSKPYNFTVIPSIQNFIDESVSSLGNTGCMSGCAWNLSLEREPAEFKDEMMTLLLQQSGFL